MSLILAIEPDERQAAHLRRVATGLRAELVHASTTEAALAALARVGERVPDLMLVPSLLSAEEDAAIAGALRMIAAAANVRMLTIPRLADPEQPPAHRGVFARLRGRTPRPVPGACDPAVFADQIAAYLAEAAAERQAARNDEDLVPAVVSPPAAIADTPLQVDDVIQIIAGAPFDAATPVPSEAAMAWVEQLPERLDGPAIARLTEEPPEPLTSEVAGEAIAGSAEGAAEQVLVSPVVASAAMAPEEMPALELPEPEFVDTPVEALPGAESSAAAPPPAPPEEPEVDINALLAPLLAELAARRVLPRRAPRPEPIAAPLTAANSSATPHSPADAPQILQPAALDPVTPDAPVSAVTAVAEAAGFEAVQAAADATASAAEAPVGNQAEYAAMARAAAEDAPDPMPFADGTHAPPAAAAAPERPAWLELIESLRQDIDRLKAERAAAPASAPEPLDAHDDTRPIFGRTMSILVTPPGATSRVLDSEEKPVSKVRRIASHRRVKAARPVQDQWGLFDPDQCGFAALRAKLDEISAREEASA